MSSLDSTGWVVDFHGTKLDFRSLLLVAVHASQEILNIYNSGDIGVTLKEDSSPVTKADMASNMVITDGLRRLHPEIPIISEEVQCAAYTERKNYSAFWSVDPLDGTKEFVRRSGDFTVNIGLNYNGTPVAGIVTVPVTQVAYIAFEGKGAFKGKYNGEEFDLTTFEPIKPRPWKRGERACIAVSHSHMTASSEGLVALFVSPQLVKVGSSLKLLMVADGRCHTYIRNEPTCEWDTSASHAIVKAAGGEVYEIADPKPIPTDDDDPFKHISIGQPLTYNKISMLNPGFIVMPNRYP